MSSAGTILPAICSAFLSLQFGSGAAACGESTVVVFVVLPHVPLSFLISRFVIYWRPCTALCQQSLFVLGVPSSRADVSFFSGHLHSLFSLTKKKPREAASRKCLIFIPKQ